jgi:hypothetical protein
MTFMSKAFANTVVRMAYDKSVVWAGESTGHKPKAAKASRATRRTAAANAGRRLVAR